MINGSNRFHSIICRFIIKTIMQHDDDKEVQEQVVMIASWMKEKKTCGWYSLWDNGCLKNLQ